MRSFDASPFVPCGLSRSSAAVSFSSGGNSDVSTLEVSSGLALIGQAKLQFLLFCVMSFFGRAVRVGLAARKHLLTVPGYVFYGLLRAEVWNISSGRVAPAPLDPSRVYNPCTIRVFFCLVGVFARLLLLFRRFPRECVVFMRLFFAIFRERRATLTGPKKKIIHVDPPALGCGHEWLGPRETGR